MKKFLSILIAISLIISIFPATFAETTEETPTAVTYDLCISSTNVSFKSTSAFDGCEMTRDVDGTTYYLNDPYWTGYDINRGWRIFDASNDVMTKTFRMYAKDDYLQVGSSSNKVTPDFALALKAPENAAFYFLELEGGSTSTTTAKKYNWYLDVSSDNYEETADLVFSGKAVRTDIKTAEKAIYSKAEDEIISRIESDDEYSYGFHSITLDPILNPVMTTTATATTTLSLNLTDDDATNDTATATTTVTGTDSDSAPVTMSVSNNFITYKSSDDSVATVDEDGKITAVGNGTATVYAVTSDEKYSSETNGITVTVAAPETDEPEEGLSGVTVVYDVSAARDNGGIDNFKTMDYALTNGFFEYAANSHSISTPDDSLFKKAGTSGSGRNGLRLAAKTDSDIWWALKVKVPVAGKYEPKATVWRFGGRGEGAESYMDYYLIKDDGSDMTTLLSDANLTPGTNNSCYIGEKLSVDSKLSGGQSIAFDETFDKKIELEKGEYYLVYKTRNVSGSSNYAVASNFTLDGGDGSAPMFCFKSSAEEITAGETTATVTASAKLSNPTVTTVSTTETTYTFADAELTDVTYTVASDDADVASVTSDGVVTGRSYGVATINATAKCGEEEFSDSLEISVVTPPVLDSEITYEEETHTGGKAAVTTYKFVENTPELIKTESDIALGSPVKVSADETITVGDATYNFLYWAKGATMSKKQIVSDLAEFDYLPGEGANFLIAVYEPETAGDETKAEFYNGNGQLLPTYTLDNGKLPSYPSMAGYGTAYAWALKNDDGLYTEYRAGDDVSSLTGNLMFAAMYEDLSEDITVFVDGTARSVKYGDTVTCTADSSNGTFMYWMKDGSAVSFDEIYKFLAWEDCRVEAVYGSSKPELNKTVRKIILDRFAAGEETAIMAEFIGFDDAVEKGIMFGGQKIAMSSDSSQFTVLDDAESANTAYAYAIIPDGTGYKMLTDGITNIGKTNEESIIAARRNAAESYMRQMTSVLWSPAEDITYNTGSSEFEFTLKADRIYQGLPYVYTSGTYEGFMEFAEDIDSDGVLTVTGLTPDMMKGTGGIAPIGNDCSGAVVRAWSTFGANIQAKTTRYMTEKNGFLRVGDYALNADDLVDYGIRGTDAIVTDNGKDTMFAAYAKLQKADAVVYYDASGYGHVMMIASVDPENKKVTIHDQTKANYKTTATTTINEATVYMICSVDKEYTFTELYNDGYLPITCRELREANYIPDDATFRDTLSEESHALRNIFLGTISCNKAIDEVKVTIINASGTEVQSAASTVKRGNIFSFDMGQFNELEAAKIRGSIDTDSLSSGSYTCNVTVRLSGETTAHTVRTFTFTK